MHPVDLYIDVLNLKFMGATLMQFSIINVLIWVVF